MKTKVPYFAGMNQAKVDALKEHALELAADVRAAVAKHGMLTEKNYKGISPTWRSVKTNVFDALKLGNLRGSKQSKSNKGGSKQSVLKKKV